MACPRKTAIINQAKKNNPSQPLRAVEDAAMVMLGFSNAPVEIKPQKAPLDGSTSDQILCTQLAYIQYILEFYDPDITPKQAYINYCENFDACYPE